MVYIPDNLREFVTARANGLCEYCQTNGSIVAYMEIDHIKPVSKGGKTEQDNLCLSCISCNRAKRDKLIEDQNLFNPRLDDWHKHFQWNETGTQLVGLSDKANNTIIHLKINAEQIVKARKLWVEAGWHPPI